MSNDMPCHITDMGDQFDNTPTSLDEKMAEDKAIAIIQEALLNGDKYKVYGNHVVDFSSVIDDELSCSPEFANALRALMNGDPKAVFKVRDVTNKATLKVADSIYHGTEA